VASPPISWSLRPSGNTVWVFKKKSPFNRGPEPVPAMFAARVAWSLSEAHSARMALRAARFAS
jgi:hypothetical protein